MSREARGTGLKRGGPVVMRDGQALHVRVLGQGQPVLLLHGLGMQSRHWLPFVWPYLREFRFYMPDFRGAGPSRALSFNQPDVFQNCMEDVQDVVRHFELEELLLVGYSMGASTALHWLRQDGFCGVRRYLHIDQSVCVTNRPDWTHGLLGARQPILIEGMRRVEALLDAHREATHLSELPGAVRKELAHVLETTLGGLGAGRFTRWAAALTERWPALVGLAIPNPTVSNLRAYVASYLNGHDYRPSLAACETPITFNVGMRSVLYAAEGQLAASRTARRARVVRFETSGHAIPLQEPRKFIRELGNFLHDRQPVADSPEQRG